MMLAAVPAVFVAHFALVYALVSFACPGGAEWIVLPGVVVATLAALAYYAFDAMMAGRQRRLGQETMRFIGATRQLVAMLAALSSVWVALPAFLVSPCAT